MKFTVQVNGADNGFIERLTAAADRKLAPKLRRLAARHAHQMQIAGHTSRHHAAAPAHHAVAHHVPMHRSTSHPAIGTVLARAVLRDGFKSASSARSSPFRLVDPAPDDPPQTSPADATDDPNAGLSLDGAASDLPSASADGTSVYDVSPSFDLP